MNRNQIVLSSIGGAAVVVAGVFGYLWMNACTARDEANDSYQSSCDAVRNAYNSPIAPSSAAAKEIKDNGARLETWMREARELAAKGDRATDATMTPEAFKRIMNEEARALKKLPGTAEGKIVKEDFVFGYKDFIGGGDMPTAEKLPELQRRWADVKLFVETLATAGIAELTDVQVVEKRVEEPKKKKGRNFNAKKAAPEVKTGDEYTLSFTAMPPALVRALNAFAASERFIMVDSMAFAHANDALVAALGGADKANDRDARNRRRRPRGAEEGKAEETAEEEIVKKGLVIDPESSDPLSVTLKLTVYDFDTCQGASDKKEGAE